MVRTVATAIRASGGKSSKAAKTSTTPKTANIASSNEKHTIGGNPVCPRETPSWQKPITSFFTKHVEVPRDVSENRPKEANIGEKVTDMAYLGEGCSTMIIAEKSDVFPNKENAQNTKLEDKCENKNNTLIEAKENIDEDGNKISTKKQKLDFFKHLEEVEQIN